MKTPVRLYDYAIDDVLILLYDRRGGCEQLFFELQVYTLIHLGLHINNPVYMAGSIIGTKDHEETANF